MYQIALNADADKASPCRFFRHILTAVWFVMAMAGADR
jgi:hypothetical protein